MDNDRDDILDEAGLDPDDDSGLDLDQTDDQDLEGDDEDDVTGSLRELVVFIVQNLVDDPDAVEISTERRGSSVHIQLRVPEEDLGKVIGRGGRIAKAIRTVLLVAGSRHHLRVSLDIEG